MKIDITPIDNGILVRFEGEPTPQDPLGQRVTHTFYAHDGTDLMGFIAERIEAQYGFRNGGTE